jgi:hypothetical protein
MSISTFLSSISSNTSVIVVVMPLLSSTILLLSLVLLLLPLLFFFFFYNYYYHHQPGYVSEDERNTPQAFSHFTYEASGKQMLLCDVQGVGDMYTGMVGRGERGGRQQYVFLH